MVLVKLKTTIGIDGRYAYDNWLRQIVKLMKSEDLYPQIMPDFDSSTITNKTLEDREQSVVFV